ncbi:MAG: hypothetical protein RMA76_17420 [Deltaproteobacteria bacterium]|jgi:hypothetical protein
MSDLSYFEDRAVGMRADVDAGRVEVRFGREPLVLWIDAGAIELVDRVANAVDEKRTVNVAWRADTNQIVSVVAR